MKAALAQTTILALGIALFGQSAAITKPPRTVHIKGSVTQCGKGVPGHWVVFRGDYSKAVQADAVGSYELDLPLGTWTAITTGLPTDDDSRSLSRPRHFRLAEPGSLVLNIYVRPPIVCDVGIGTPDGRPPTPEEMAARDFGCWGERFYQEPSKDGTPLEVDLFGLDNGTGTYCRAHANGGEREFASYNVLSLEAGKVTYDPYRKLLEATGNVKIEDESGHHTAHSVSFYIEDGRAIPVNAVY
jgi:hypothetical protein